MKSCRRRTPCRLARLRSVLALSLGLWALRAHIGNAGQVNYIYDERGRLVAVVDPAGETATYTYDAVGNLLSIGRHSSAQVSILTFTPGCGASGTSVTISGTGFSTTPSENTVTFNGIVGTVTSAASTQLMVSAPAG